MSDVFAKIQELENLTEMSKHERLIAGTINAIEDKVLTRGDMLPSVNKMKEETGFARMTIVKAYNELKDRGLVESTNRRGYFVANDATEQTVKVALILYAFHPFQEVFYNTFRKNLGENIELEVFFHHNNIEIFETILAKIKGRYGMYVVAPIPDPKTKHLLDGIPENKLLLVDRYEAIDDAYSHITQEFENSTYNVLLELLPAVQKYSEIVLFYYPDSDYPIEILHAFMRFLKHRNIKGHVEKNYTQGTVRKGTVYLTIGDGDLWQLLKDCIENDYEIGKDVGVFSANDSPVKEIVAGGITTFSVDFAEMGKLAADFVLHRKPTKTTVPTVLIKRKSI